jgi:hypothetical protein
MNPDRIVSQFEKRLKRTLSGRMNEEMPGIRPTPVEKILPNGTYIVNGEVRYLMHEEANNLGHLGYEVRLVSSQQKE